MKKVVFLILSFFCIAFLYSQENVKNVIVMANQENLDGGEKVWLPNSVKDKFESNLQTYTSYSLVSSNESQIKELQKKFESAAFGEDSAIEIGKLTSASHGVFLTVRKVGLKYTITAEFTNLSSGKNIAKFVSDGITNKDGLSDGKGCSVDLLTIKFCDKLGITITGSQRLTLEGKDFSDGEALAGYNQEIENYKKQMASLDKEIASLSNSSDLSASSKKAQLESDRAIAEQRKKSAEEQKSRLAEIEKAKKEEASRNASRTKEQQEKILAVSKESNAKLEELKKLKVAGLSALGKIGLIERKKSAIIDIQNNVLREQNVEESKIRKEYDDKIAAVKNAPYRTFEKNADGSVAPEAVAERNENIENLKKERDSKLADVKSKIAKATYDSQAEIAAEIVGDLTDLKKTTFYANTLNNNLRVKVGNYNRSSDGWQVFYTILSDGIALYSGQTDIKYTDLEEMMPSGMDKWDAVDMYDSLFKCGEPVLIFGVEYSIGIVESNWSSYDFYISKLSAYDTKNVSVDNKGDLSGHVFACGDKRYTWKEMKPTYYLRGLAEFVLYTYSEKEKLKKYELLYKAKAGKETYKKDLFANLVRIPGKDYSMLKTEVTQILYASIMKSNPSEFIDEDGPVEGVSWYDAIYFCNKLSVECGLTPVYSVNGQTDVNKWDYKPHKGYLLKGEIEQYKRANGFRLPTSEEWVYASKGGENYKYSGSDNLDEVGWYEDNSWHKDNSWYKDDSFYMRWKRWTHRVGQKKANGYGLYDMSGNVSEWVWDRNMNIQRSDDRYYLGGGYSSDADGCKVVSRESCYAYNRMWGFRIVRNAE